MSSADGGVYMVDGFLDVIDAATGDAIVRRPLSEDPGTPTQGVTRNGASIAEHAVFASATVLPTTSGAPAGLIVACRSAMM